MFVEDQGILNLCDYDSYFKQTKTKQKQNDTDNKAIFNLHPIRKHNHCFENRRIQTQL